MRKKELESILIRIVMQTLLFFLRPGRQASYPEATASSGFTSAALAIAPSSAIPDSALVDFRLRPEERFNLKLNSYWAFQQAILIGLFEVDYNKNILMKKEHIYLGA